jgi:hypothetical protein
MFYGVLFVKRIVNMQDRATGVTPDKLNTFSLKRLDQNVRAIDFDGGLTQRTGLSGGLEFRFGHFHDVTFVNFLTKKLGCLFASSYESAARLWISSYRRLTPNLNPFSSTACHYDTETLTFSLISHHLCECHNENKAFQIFSTYLRARHKLF